MAMSKIDRIDREIEKTRGKITEFQNKLKELEAQRTEFHVHDPRRADELPARRRQRRAARRNCLP